MIHDFGIIGGGIVGLATAQALGEKFPRATLAVFEKEPRLGAHQTGHNSGVIHSGIYYKPGSLKARLGREGNLAMVDFCRTHHIPFELCGKLIVATTEGERPALERLYARARDNQIEAHLLSPEQAREIEPHVACVAALRIPSTGIVDYPAVCLRLAEMITARGGEVFLHTPIQSLRLEGGIHVLETPQGPRHCRFLVNCAGLQSDRVARKSGLPLEARIIPFRGDYYELKENRRFLVRNLIYPLPAPGLPFLGVHFTRLIDGHIHAGPNAVLSLKREGYGKLDFDWTDAWETLAFKGFWKLAGHYWETGLQEWWRALNQAVFVRDLQKLVPEVRKDDLVPAESGVRAQCVTTAGELMDDFYLLEAPGALHVCNAPSPAATASLSIGRYIADRVRL